MKRFGVAALVLSVCAPILARADSTTFTTYEPATSGWAHELGGGSTGPVGGNSVGGQTVPSYTVGGYSIGGEGWQVGGTNPVCAGRYPVVVCVPGTAPVRPPVTLPKVTVPVVTLPGATVPVVTLPVVPVPVVPIPVVPCCNRHEESALPDGSFSVDAASGPNPGRAFSIAAFSVSANATGRTDAIAWTFTYTITNRKFDYPPVETPLTNTRGYLVATAFVDALDSPRCSGGAGPQVLHPWLGYATPGTHLGTMKLVCPSGETMGEGTASATITFYAESVRRDVDQPWFYEATLGGHVDAINFDDGAP